MGLDRFEWGSHQQKRGKENRSHWTAEFLGVASISQLEVSNPGPFSPLRPRFLGDLPYPCLTYPVKKAPCALGKFFYRHTAHVTQQVTQSFALLRGKQVKPGIPFPKLPSISALLWVRHGARNLGALQYDSRGTFHFHSEPDPNLFQETLKHPGETDPVVEKNDG